MRDILAPYLEDPLPEKVYEKLEIYLNLLMRWNVRTNLTSIRDRDGIIQRHFGESLFLAHHLPYFQTLLDFGSGAGFPGIPIQLVYPQSTITLAESQGKKGAFLREAVRTLDLAATVWAQRVESMPSQTFEVVTLRAVDNMAEAIHAAVPRVSNSGALAIFSGESAAELPERFHWRTLSIPNSSGKVHLGLRTA
ncbi:MAG: 16S rRNA (guanine(527)-N(7))-methyltransferase RsmG [Acidobacteria bacterium]|nr:16S rRNA (guanine(527)-N(7))-methyltransferase RsmG [Acidobacteriota bacterium]